MLLDVLERPEPRGVFAHEIDKVLDAIESDLVNVVLNSLGIQVRSLLFDSQNLKESDDRSMFLLSEPRHLSLCSEN